MAETRSTPSLSLLADRLTEAAALPGVSAAALTDLRAKLTGHHFHLVVAGEFKRGKSSLINALLGEDVLPTGVVPLTSVVTRLEFAETVTAQVLFENGQRRDIPLSALPDFVTEKANPRNAKKVVEVVVGYPADWLRGGLRLVDTPGIGSMHQHNTDVTYRYLPQADAVILVTAVDQPMTRYELDFLEDVRQYAGKVFVLLNRIDLLDAAELAESLAFAEAAIQERLGGQARVFPVSARLARRGRLGESRLPEFDAALRHFLQAESGEVWADSVRRNLQRLLAEARLTDELELKALTAPIRDLDAKLAAFAGKKQETLQARLDFDALLQADTARLLKERLEPDLDAFKARLLPDLLGDLDAWYRALRPQGSKILQEGLQQRSIAAVRRAYDAWRMEEDMALGKECEALCERFWIRIQENVDELLRYSADLFEIPYVTEMARSLWQTQAGFYYKFWEEPPALFTLTNGFIRLLPGFIGHRLLLRQAQRRMAELVDMQGGRLRHDFAQRIHQGVEVFGNDMQRRLQETLAGIEAALTQGRSLRDQGEAQTSARIAELEQALKDIDVLEARLAP